MSNNDKNTLNHIIEYENILKNFYENIYGEDIKEVPLTAGQYIVANRMELGLIYQKLISFEDMFEVIKNEIINDAKKEAESIIQEAKLKTFDILDDNLSIKDEELEIVRTIKDLAAENLVYLYKQMMNETQKNIDTLINIEKKLQNNLNELELRKDVKKIKKIY